MDERRGEILAERSAPYQNPLLPPDVDDNTRVELNDLVLVVRSLRDEVNPHTLPDQRNTRLLPPPYVDVSGDNQASLADLLAVVTVLRNQIQSAAEPERSEGGRVNAPFSTEAAGLRHFVKPSTGNRTPVMENCREPQPCRDGQTNPARLLARRDSTAASHEPASDPSTLPQRRTASPSLRELLDEIAADIFSAARRRGAKQVP